MPLVVLLIDRYILVRFVANFVLLFVLLFLFAVAVDLVLSLGNFIEKAAEITGDDASFVASALTLTRMILDFQGPRFFQFYAFMHGLIAIGAMGFTLAQMYRHRELLALLAAGIGMQRIAMPFIVGVFAISAVQLVNQELFLPRIAPLLLRGQSEIGRRTAGAFAVALTPDGRGALFQAPSFDPETGALAHPTILEPGTDDGTRRRVTADAATWQERPDGDGTIGGWALTNGTALVVRQRADGDLLLGAGREQAVEFYPTDLSPRVLVMRRYGQFVTMLSLRQIAQMLDTPGVRDREMLVRQRYARFSVVFVNVLIMWLTLPTFLIREPASLTLRTLACAGLALPGLLGAGVSMMIDLPGIPPTVSVFLPVIVLIPLVLAQWTQVRT